MRWSGLERNKLDFILTDLLPVEISELFSFSQLYAFLLQKPNQKILSKLIQEIKQNKAEGNRRIFENGWGAKPLKFKIFKGTETMREMSVIQPFSAVNLFLFIECYQDDILNYFEKHHGYSIRYYKKNTNLYYKARSGHMTQYFQEQAKRVGHGIIQQAGNYFTIGPFESINSFTDSRVWRMCNFKYKYYAKLDYKACFDSIYTHAFTWIIERNVVDAKSASNSHLLITIDRILQNINGRSSNGIVVGPEFSRMIAEVLLQHIDSEICISLSKDNIIYDVDYVAFRYVDDIFLFANQPQVIEQILSKYKTIGERYLLRLNELKLTRGSTPCLPKEWLAQTRQISDIIGQFFYQGKKSDYEKLPEDEQFLVRTELISIDRIKDEIAVLVKKNSEDKRTIVSFLLSTLLNNICKKKDGYKLFGKQDLSMAVLLIDIALHIYAFFPSFDQTRKIISIIAYIDSEIDFRNDKVAKIKLSRTINKYSFIFCSGNVFDLCDWFPFFYEYNIALDTKTEEILIRAAEEYNDPIIWANLLLYSRYYKPFNEELVKKVEGVVEQQISKLSNKAQLMQVEFWYVLIFHNCPFINSQLQVKISDIIKNIKKNCGTQKQSTNHSGSLLPSEEVTKLICDFLEQHSPKGKKPEESLFNWKGNHNFANQITYRTYQRTVFKRYRKNTYGLNASLD